MNSNNRIAATLVFPGDIVCPRNIGINTLHKGDDDDDYNNNDLSTDLHKTRYRSSPYYAIH